jgi:hypothetical protein
VASPCGCGSGPEVGREGYDGVWAEEKLNDTLFMIGVETDRSS